MIKKIIQVTLLSFLFIGATTLNILGLPMAKDTTGVDSVEMCAMENSVFEHGETAVYTLYYKMGPMWIAAGTATFNVVERDNDFQLSAVGTTFPGYEWVFKVEDKFESHVSKETLLPNTAIRDISEGNYKLWDKIDFDQENLTAEYHRGKTRDNTKMKPYDLEGCMHDVLSIIYFTRNIDFDKFESGDSFPVSIFLDKETYNLNVKYQGEEDDVKVKGLGRFNTIKFSPQLIEGNVFDGDSQMEIFATNDENKLPLMINSPLKVGSVRAVLTEYNGLKYDLTSQVK